VDTLFARGVHFRTVGASVVVVERRYRQSPAGRYVPFLAAAVAFFALCAPLSLCVFSRKFTITHLFHVFAHAVISVLIALLKPDVRRAVIELLTCRCTCWRSRHSNDSSDFERNNGRRRPSDPFDAMQSQWWNSTRLSWQILIRSSSRPSNSSVDYVDRSNDFSSRSELCLSPCVGNGEMTPSPAKAAPSSSGLNGGSHRSSTSSSNTVFWPPTTSSSARGGNQQQNGDNDDEEMENGRRRPSWHKHSVGAVIAEEEGVDSYEEDDNNDHATETAAFYSSSSCDSSKSPEANVVVVMDATTTTITAAAATAEEAVVGSMAGDDAAVAVANHQQQRPSTPPPQPQQEQQEQDHQPQPQPPIGRGGND
jgi:hypothetical protein